MKSVERKRKKKKSEKMMKRRKRMSRRLHKPGEGKEGGGQGDKDSLWRRAMSLRLFGEMKGEQKGQCPLPLGEQKNKANN